MGAGEGRLNVKKYSLKKLFVAPAALGVVLSFGLLGPTASADDNSDKRSAAQAAVDEYGGCTINVESDDYNGTPAWEVELKNTNVKNGANGRIEVKVAKGTYEILAHEDEDSDDGECDDSYPSADSDDNGDGDGDSSVNIYITPGKHTSGGREWRTTCEAYSQTERCRTEIWSTEVEYRSGKFVKNNGWHFNNLTYKESKRALWEGNPLGNDGKYTINGRQWRTECETFTSGRNGCRSYIVADVVQATKNGNSYTYKMVTKEVFNNIVMFKISE